MSFLIDDILKQNCSKGNIDIPANKSAEVNLMRTGRNASILECTLTSTDNYRSSVHQEVFSNKFSTDCYPETSYRDLYLPKIPNGRCAYPKEAIWASYMACPVILNCPHLHTRRKGGQIRFTADQTEELEKQFNSHKYLSPEDRKQLADFLRLSDRQVKTWFQNRRAKWRRNNQFCLNHSSDLVINNIRENKNLSDESNINNQ